MNNSAWKSKSSLTEKPWGSEFVWNALAGVIAGKVLNIRSGHRTSFKYYNIKDEVLYVMYGQAKITYADEKYLMGRSEYSLNTDTFKQGECLNIQKKCPYRIEAIDDCIIIEIGSRQTSDMVRLLDDYGRKCTGDEKIINRLLEDLDE